MFFGAGWDYVAYKKRPRRIRSARVGKMALLTTRPPGADEGERLVIGCLFINDVVDHPGEETKILGDKRKSIVVDYDKVKVRFWDHYKNAGAEDLILWASGLFRYVTDNTVLNILKGIGEKYKNSSRDVRKIVELICYYEEIVGKK